jgi:lycopene cyclase domain-containing protein
MTYSGFLVRFLVFPIVVLAVLAYRDRRLGIALPRGLSLLPAGGVVAGLAVIALAYTTLWDNYLVATGVWWYDPARVTGITFGWVPVEEYTFFVLQPVMAGMWLLFLGRRLPAPAEFRARRGVRAGTAALASVLWLAALAVLVSGWPPGTYLALILVWALPTIALQLVVGADILWHHRGLMMPALTSTTLYLCAADALAIHSGIWTINPERSLPFMLGGVLPLEEAIFFLMTNTLLVFGLVLGLARESATRLPTQFGPLRLNRGRQPSQQMERSR